jgi:hypothetical protein
VLDVIEKITYPIDREIDFVVQHGPEAVDALGLNSIQRRMDALYERSVEAWEAAARGSSIEDATPPMADEAVDALVAPLVIYHKV